MALEPEPEPEPRPGLDESEYESLTWLGVNEDPTPHEAPKGAVEQAAFELAVNPPAEPLNAEPSPPAPAIDTQPLADLAAALALATESVLDQLAAAAAEFIAAQASPPEPPQAAPPPPTAPAEPVAVAASSQSPPTTEPTPPGAIESDRESDAQAKTETLEVRPGRPLAGAGLDIRTVRPKWPVTVTLMAVPRNPLVEITFGPGGKVVRAAFVDGQGTGYADIDGPLLDAVYRWTATGKALAALPEQDPGVTLRVRILLRGT